MRLGAIILSLLIGFTNAQDGVNWEPESPVQGGQVIIYYNLETRAILPSQTDPVYLHLGFDDWNDTDDYTMYKNTDGFWEYVLDLPEDVAIVDFAFTDNIDDYSAGTWDNNGGYGNDFHISVYSEGLSVVIVNPEVDNSYDNPFRSPIMLTEGEELPISFTYVTTGAPLDSLFLEINSLQISSTDSDTLKYTLIPVQWNSDKFAVNCIGKDVTGWYDTTEFAVIVRSEQISEKPTSNIIPGVNQSLDGEITFALFAPYKEYVYLIGDFNNWEVDNDYLMYKYEASEDSTLWWLGIPINTDDFSYQYLVDGEIRIADPYSELVLDPWNDDNIPAIIYQNIPAYPKDMTEEPVSHLRLNRPEYKWQYSEFEKPEQKELVIYELLIRDFLEQHNYSTLIDTLDYFENLGINAIELMPINEFEGNSSWGYNPSFYFAPDKYYGMKNSLKTFIDECHKRGITVIQDIVLNHSFDQSPLVRLYWDEENDRPAANNPWFNIKSPNTTYYWGNDFNHESEHTQYFVDRVLRYWIDEFNVDGYRLDFTKGFTNRGGDGSTYDARRIAILERIADEVWSYAPSTYLILEHFGDNVEEKELADYGFMLWGNANYSYSEATMGYNSNSDFSWGYYKKRGWTEPNLVTYMESHDEERLMYKNIQYGNSSGDYDITELATALDRQKLAAAFFFTLPGPKMIWQFGELGYDYSIDYNGRVGEKPIRWDYLDDADRKELYDMYSNLINIRNKNEVFTSPNTSVELSVSGSDGLKRIRLSHSSMNVVIVGNFGVTTQSIDPDFYYSATWYDDINSDSLDVTDTHATIELVPGEFRIYSGNKHLLVVEDKKENSDKPYTFSLSQNFPNPFNPVTTIQFEIPVENVVQLTIYNLAGKAVGVLTDRLYSAGTHQINWNASYLTSGIYFYRITAGNYTETRKMILIK